MAKIRKSDQQQLWAEAQRRCRLSDEAVRIDKELGLNPRSLIKNISSETWRTWSLGACWRQPVAAAGELPIICR